MSRLPLARRLQHFGGAISAQSLGSTLRQGNHGGITGFLADVARALNRGQACFAVRVEVADLADLVGEVSI